MEKMGVSRGLISSFSFLILASLIAGAFFLVSFPLTPEKDISIKTFTRNEALMRLETLVDSLQRDEDGRIAKTLEDLQLDFAILEGGLRELEAQQRQTLDEMLVYLSRTLGISDTSIFEPGIIQVVRQKKYWNGRINGTPVLAFHTPFPIGRTRLFEVKLESATPWAATLPPQVRQKLEGRYIGRINELLKRGGQALFDFQCKSFVKLGLVLQTDHRDHLLLLNQLSHEDVSVEENQRFLKILSDLSVVGVHFSPEKMNASAEREVPHFVFRGAILGPEPQLVKRLISLLQHGPTNPQSRLPITGTVEN